MQLPFVLNSHDVLDGKQKASGNVVVIGGGMVGMEVAEYLAEKGCKVTDLEMLKEFCADMDSARKTCVTENVYALGINLVTEGERLIICPAARITASQHGS